MRCLAELSISSDMRTQPWVFNSMQQHIVAMQKHALCPQLHADQTL